MYRCKNLRFTIYFWKKFLNKYAPIRAYFQKYEHIFIIIRAYKHIIFLKNTRILIASLDIRYTIYDVCLYRIHNSSRFLLALRSRSACIPLARRSGFLYYELTSPKPPLSTCGLPPTRRAACYQRPHGWEFCRAWGHVPPFQIFGG